MSSRAGHSTRRQETTQLGGRDTRVKEQLYSQGELGRPAKRETFDSDTPRSHKPIAHPANRERKPTNKRQSHESTKKIPRTSYTQYRIRGQRKREEGKEKGKRTTGRRVKGRWQCKATARTVSFEKGGFKSRPARHSPRD